MCVCLASLICRTATCVQLPKTRWVIRSHVYCSVPRECSLLSSLAHSFKSTFRPLIRPTHYFHWLFRRFSDILSVLSLNDYHNTLNLQGYMLYLTHTCISLSLSLSFFLSFSFSVSPQKVFVSLGENCAIKTKCNLSKSALCLSPKNCRLQHNGRTSSPRSLYSSSLKRSGTDSSVNC